MGGSIEGRDTVRQIANQILSQFTASRGSDVVPLGDFLASKRRSETYHSEMRDVQARLRGSYDPVHAVYIAAQNLVAIFSEELTRLPELQPFVQVVSAAESVYRPDGPPFSPLTRSHFTSWAFFDVTFGPDAETLASLIQDLGRDLCLDPEMLDTIDSMGRSRMGVYQQSGDRSGRVLLRDLADGCEYDCYAGTGYQGEAGQLWYVRLMPPLSSSGYSVVFTTPYILTSSREAWQSFINRALPQLLAPPKPRPLSQAVHDLFKRGLHVNYWNEFIFQAYVGSQGDAIFLAGVPDAEGRLSPGHQENRIK